MDYKLYTLTNEELKELKDSIDTEVFNRKKKKEKELTEAFEKAWKDIENAGLNIYLSDGDIEVYFNEIYIE